MFFVKKRKLEIPDFLLGKRISFDVDGVKAQTSPLAVKLYNQRYYDKKKNSDLTEYDSVSRWIFKITKDKNKADQEALDIWNHQGVQLNAKPVGGASVLSKLLWSFARELDVHYVTSRPGYTKKVTLAWFNKWLPWIKEKNIHTSNLKNGPQNGFKATLIRELNIDIHFEDSIKHAEEILKTSPKTLIVLVRQPWNMNINKLSLSKSIIVAKNQRNVPKLLSAYQALLQNQKYITDLF
jgi:uncharacterized HAD superfamily protein